MGLMKTVSYTHLAVPPFPVRILHGIRTHGSQDQQTFDLVGIYAGNIFVGQEPFEYEGNGSGGNGSRRAGAGPGRKSSSGQSTCYVYARRRDVRVNLLKARIAPPGCLRERVSISIIVGYNNGTFCRGRIGQCIVCLLYTSRCV